MNIKCQYCKKPAELVSGSALFPKRRDLWMLEFWRCKKCKAHIGCKPNSCEPTGELANAELRKAKRKAFSAFTSLWKSGNMSRSDAYNMLAEKFQIPNSMCCISKFDLEMCLDTIRLCKELPKQDLMSYNMRELGI